MMPAYVSIPQGSPPRLQQCALQSKLLINWLHTILACQTPRC